ncbi:MAG: isoamylase early set domain-containing protein [bacterium]|nr:isoamylase early set domain-containing protein [bacterium]
MSEKKSVIFSLFAPEASTVSVAGSFNLWEIDKHPMKQKKDGTWTKKVSLPHGRHEYQFVINGEIWEIDKNAEKYCSNDLGGMNSVLLLEE